VINFRFAHFDMQDVILVAQMLDPVDESVSGAVMHFIRPKHCSVRQPMVVAPAAVRRAAAVAWQTIDGGLPEARRGACGSLWLG